MASIRRGDVYFADFGPIVNLPSGDPSREIAKKRPVIVVSANALNRVSDHQPFYVVVVPGTTGTSSFRDCETNVGILPSESGLKDKGVFLAHQMRSLDVRRLDRVPSGKLSAKALARIETALRKTLNLV